MGLVKHWHRQPRESGWVDVVAKRIVDYGFPKFYQVLVIGNVCSDHLFQRIQRWLHKFLSFALTAFIVITCIILR